MSAHAAAIRWAAAVALLCVLGGCAKYNTYFNAKRAFNNAERVRDDALRKNQDPPKPVGQQKTDYEMAIAKAQKLLDDYPGHKLSDDALFLRAKSYFRLESYRMSIQQFDLLFQNFPATEYLEESLYLQALNYLLLGALDRSQEYLGQLERAFPNSRYQAEVSRVSGDNFVVMEDWESAAAAYRQYLELGDKAKDRDRVSLKLAECLWELGHWDEVEATLAGMLAKAPPGEVRFRAELLRGRALTRSGALEKAGEQLGSLHQPAAFHKAEGDLALAEAELLVARDKGDDAVALLEGMPTEWQTPKVKALAADMLGYRLLEQHDYEKAHGQFKAALAMLKDLEDPERTKLLSDQLRDYLAAELALADAKGERVPRLKLLEANAMLFGFDRPAMAAALYREAAADSTADSLLAASALYGLWVTYGTRLDNPDSAALAATDLRARFPRSAQAREVTGEGRGDLFAYLSGQRAEQQRHNYAKLTAEEKAELEKVVEVAVATGGPAGEARAAVRRRMVYLSRRANLQYPPPEVVIPLGGRPGVASSPAGGPPRSGVAPGAAAQAMGLSPDPAPTGEPVPGTQPGTTAGPQGPPTPVPTPASPEAKPAVPEEKPKPKKERDPNWDRLRTPFPGARP